MADDRGAGAPRPPSAASALRERLTIYPEFAARPDPYLAGEDAGAGRGAARRRRPGRRGTGRPEPIAWQDPDVQWKPRTIALTFAKARRRRPARRRRRRSTATSTRSTSPARGRRATSRPSGSTPRSRPRCRRRRAHRPITDEEALALFRGRGRRARGTLPRRRRPARRGGGRRGHLRRQPEHQLHERLLRRVPLLRVRAAGGGRRVLHPHARRGRRPRGGGMGAGAPPRCACRAASIPTCPAPSTSTCSTR